MKRRSGRKEGTWLLRSDSACVFVCMSEVEKEGIKGKEVVERKKERRSGEGVEEEFEKGECCRRID